MSIIGNAITLGGGGGGESADLGTKSITANGTYAATDDSLDGYSEVTVNVSGGSSGTIDGIKVWTHSIGGQDASIDIQKFSYDTSSGQFTMIGSAENVSFWPFYNGEIEYYDYDNKIRIKYTAPSWNMYAIGNLTLVDGLIYYSDGQQIVNWEYRNTKTYFLI